MKSAPRSRIKSAVLCGLIALNALLLAVFALPETLAESHRRPLKVRSIARSGKSHNPRFIVNAFRNTRPRWCRRPSPCARHGATEKIATSPST